MLQHRVERLFYLNGLLPRAGAIRPEGNKTAEPSHPYGAVKGRGGTSRAKARTETANLNRRHGSVHGNSALHDGHNLERFHRAI